MTHNRVNQELEWQVKDRRHHEGKQANYLTQIQLLEVQDP